VITVTVPEGSKVNVGAPVAEVDDSVQAQVSGAAAVSGPAASAKIAAPLPQSEGVPSVASSGVGPAAKKLMAENPGLANIVPTGRQGQVTKADVLAAASTVVSGSGSQSMGVTSDVPQVVVREVDAVGSTRTPMTSLRKKIAQRLVGAQHTAAILTTFNEIDLKEVMALRAMHKEPFKAKHGVSLSFMSFFTRAVVESLKKQPLVNSAISADGQDIISFSSIDIGIAVGTDRGLVVPVLRQAEHLGFVQIEKAIAGMAQKARDKKLSMADMEGGTFTISNGGTYGSLLSTPIINPPQSAILGMHKIQERPVAINGAIEIRPMMYVALSYDHRLIDGKEAVSFLVNIKELLEKPATLGLEV
jgi:2-oxoglutarate dehydrogenase E2 component (dihydrolipoamide succinyltransferase)